MTGKKIRIALVILENQEQEFAMQLRSQIPSIAHPGRWGCFGGHIEENEIPAKAALREIEEELSVILNPEKLTFHSTFKMGKEMEYSIFHYLVKNELDHAVLMEGEDFSYFNAIEIEQGEKKGKKTVDFHRDLLMNLIDSKSKN